MIARSQLAILDNNSGIGVKQAQTKITETISNKYIQKLRKIGVSKKIVRNLMAILKPFLKNSRCSNDYNSTILLTEN